MAIIPIKYHGTKGAGRSIEDAIYDLTQKSRALQNFIDMTIEKNGGWILQKLKLRLWNQGIGGDGKKLYNKLSTLKNQKRYALWKKKAGFRSKPVNLRLTGAFWDSMKVFSTNGEITIKASDEKTPELIERYGENILTLTDKEQQWVIETIINPAVKKFLEK